MSLYLELQPINHKYHAKRILLVNKINKTIIHKVSLDWRCIAMI